MRIYATKDPRGFLANYPNGAVLDEVQRVPELISYLQQILDESVANGLFILTGSNNFLLQEQISQSLAGRVGYLNLLPLTLNEINDHDSNSNQLMFKGGYPALYNENTDPTRWFANYIRTYIERDVRMKKKHNKSNHFRTIYSALCRSYRAIAQYEQPGSGSRCGCKDNQCLDQRFGNELCCVQVTTLS